MEDKKKAMANAITYMVAANKVKGYLLTKVMVSHEIGTCKFLRNKKIIRIY